jgi:GT2 family glycosyltransferase
VSVWAVVPHYGDPGTTRRTVDGLLAGTVSPDVILVVDNQGDLAGDDFAHGRVRIERPGRNLGFAGAAALGARRALDAAAGWIWFVNNDARPDADCLAALLAAGDAFPQAALLSPLIAYGDGGGLWYAGGELRRADLRVRHRTRVATEEPHAVDFVTGCALLARAAFVLASGPMDEGLFMYYEDADWGLRAQRHGWTLMVVPAARVVHDVARRDGRRRFSALAVYQMTRNRLLVARRYGVLPGALAGAVSWGARQTIKGVGQGDAGAALRAVAAGALDGLRGRCGAPDRVAGAAPVTTSGAAPVARGRRP